MGVPLLSVIIPLYNSTKFFTRCIESICSQTTADKIEVILVDDGSTDNSLELAKTIFVQRKFTGRVLSLRQDSNQGVAYARKLGVSRATGKYITFCDSDDWMEPEMCEKLLIKAECGNCDMVICDYLNEYTNKPNCISSPCYSEDFLSALLQCKVTGALWNKLVRRQIFLSDIFCFPTRSFCEDYVYSIQYAILANKIGYIKEPLYHYCHRADSIVQSTSKERVDQRISDNLINISLVEQILEKFQLQAQYKDELIALKLIVKNSIRLHIPGEGYYQLWKNTYPELSFQIFNSRFISWRSRAAYFGTLFGLYPLLRALKLVDK